MESDPQTREPQYQMLVDLRRERGVARLGLMVNESWQCDPRRTLFTLSRYKFVAKMLSGRKRVLEIGCADAFGTRIVQQEVGHVTAVDFDPLFIQDVRDRMDPHWPMDCFVHDMLDAPVPGRFDAAYCLDVIEHIVPEREGGFLANLCRSLERDGVLIVGAPSLESQAHASPQSRAGHVNCKSGNALKALLAAHFENVFMFSMNDEVVHTGFFPMAHYLLGLCCTPRRDVSGNS